MYWILHPPCDSEGRFVGVGIFRIDSASLWFMLEVGDWHHSVICAKLDSVFCILEMCCCRHWPHCYACFEIPAHVITEELLSSQKSYCSSQKSYCHHRRATVITEELLWNLLWCQHILLMQFSYLAVTGSFSTDLCCVLLTVWIRRNANCVVASQSWGQASQPLTPTCVLGIDTHQLHTLHLKILHKWIPEISCIRFYALCLMCVWLAHQHTLKCWQQGSMDQAVSWNLENSF
jgi:hypothetical protein